MVVVVVGDGISLALPVQYVEHGQLSSFARPRCVGLRSLICVKSCSLAIFCSELMGWVWGGTWPLPWKI